jgi:drug/metabolite transporter (DMT)-like permease
MTLIAVALVLVSALLHATWNLFGKGSEDKSAFFLAQGLSASLFCLPGVVTLWPDEGLTAMAWTMVILSGVAHAGYALFLVKSYEVGDLSVAYPLSRTAPVLVLLWDVTLGRQPLSLWGGGGVLIAVAGALLVQWPMLRRLGVRGVLHADVTRYALTTALFIAMFTIIDKQGVAHLHPFVFLFLILAGETLVFAARIGKNLGARVSAEWRRRWRLIVVTAIVGPVSYLLILWALRTAPATYVLSLRQTSIVFGVILGRMVLSEVGTRYPLAGAIVISVGGALIALRG